ncbi:unnamed protein product [Oppiella nova]|uniref:Tr-type G domain-containing protein n=1 Tax=Oppiella nova TaxID=334625 RepID=A0A7R9LIN8_9ACAR|nr:unnamed protein product [Oppiella nova]CAG2163971.1 unnamed protein product [Oppiella nova]
MSRHRGVKNMNYSEEYDEYYNTYGQSLEEDICISPNTERQFMYNRSQPSTQRPHDSSDLMNTSVTEEDDDAEQDLDYYRNLSDMDQIERVKLISCVEEMENVVGETIPESLLIRAAKIHNYDIKRALDSVLNNHTFDPNDYLRNEPKGATNRVRDQCDTEVAKINKTLGQLVVNKSEPNLKALASPVRRNLDKSRLESGHQNQYSSPNSPASSRTGSRMSSPNHEKSSESKTTKPIQTKALNPELALIEYNKNRNSGKPNINMVVIGHVDAGKSTLMGHLLYRLGFVSQKAIHRYETDSKKMGKNSFLYAWVLDETPEERSRGITMDIAESRFETNARAVTLLDAPGHKDFIPNMITGATQADVALLVVDATKGEFETGFDLGGQTREHTLLIRSLGISQLGVVVNKLENVDWSQDRYQEIVVKLSAFLKQVGFKEQDISYVPCSGLTGENLTERSKIKALCSWYSGPSLVEIIDNFKPPDRLISKPFRLSLNDVFKGLTSGICISGRVEAGTVTVGQKLVILPAGEQCVVKSIAIDDTPIPTAFVGDHIVMTLLGCDLNKISVGNLVCDASNPAPVTTRFEARIVLFNNIEIPITRGFPVIFHYQSLSEQAVVRKLISQVHKGTGQVIKNKPRCLLGNSSGFVEIEVQKPVCVELYKEYKDLGRFMIRASGATIAAGVITKIVG